MKDGRTADHTGAYRMRDTQAILAAARLRQHERRQAEALLRRMACIEAAILRNPAAGLKRDRLERDINRLRQEMLRARAGFARRPLVGDRHRNDSAIPV